MENMGHIMLNIDFKDIKLNSGDQGELGSNTGVFFFSQCELGTFVL